jgi:UDP-N-acetylmuramate--alanine ligase
MRKISFDLGILHFTGIGGIGMSGIAEVMHNLGYQVRGSDLAESANVKRLKALGIPVVIGHAAKNVKDAKAVVVSSAVKKNNPEIVAARELRIPVVPRAEMLAELMRLKWCVSVAGTHGKTTTTSMIAALFDAGGFDPTVINGGIINAYGTNARLGAGEWMVVEADESDGTFVRLPATIAVVTNIDPEHLDHYGTFEKEKAAFLNFVEKVPFYGVAVMCLDHPEVQSLIPQVLDRKIVTYGFSPQADVRALNLRIKNASLLFDVAASGRLRSGERRIKDLLLNMPGRHNVQNAAAAIAVGLEMGITEAAIRKAFSEFGGVKRRFTRVGTFGEAVIIDDYAHHPVEIEAVLKAARDIAKERVIAVVQPHRYTRLQNLFEDFCAAFNDADEVVVAPVYEAGETLIPGVTHEAFAAALKEHGHKNVHVISGEDELAPVIAKIARGKDLVVCLGAGSITYWAHALEEELAKLAKREAS